MYLPYAHGVQETLTGEFDPKIAPKQYVFTE